MKPFLPDEVDALRALAQTWPEAEMVILGASALRCSMPMSWRTTEDLDLSVTASTGDATAALSLLPGWSPDPRQEQRWHTPAGVAVDIVPASAEALTRGYIEWPRAGFRMSLLGIRLAFEFGVPFRVASDLQVRIAPIHVLTVLKAVAYLDRPGSREKDIGDDSDRRYSSEVPGDLTEFEDVAPYLLGRDVSAVVNPEERRKVVDFIDTIDDGARGPRLVARIAILGPPAWRDPDEVLERIRAFCRGMEPR